MTSSTSLLSRFKTICIMAADHHERRTEYAARQSPDAKPLSSIVICPSTLTSHWLYEIRKFCDSLSALCYVGAPRERRALLPEFDKHDVIIVSYEVLRNDIDYFQQRQYNYCVLDEGHVIRNESKVTKVRGEECLAVAHCKAVGGEGDRMNKEKRA